MTGRSIAWSYLRQTRGGFLTKASKQVRLHSVIGRYLDRSEIGPQVSGYPLFSTPRRLGHVTSSISTPPPSEPPGLLSICGVS